MSKYRAIIRCAGQGCGRVISLRDGKPLSDGKKIECPNGHLNILKQKSSGKFKVVLK